MFCEAHLRYLGTLAVKGDSLGTEAATCIVPACHVKCDTMRASYMATGCGCRPCGHVGRGPGTLAYETSLSHGTPLQNAASLSLVGALGEHSCCYNPAGRMQQSDLVHNDNHMTCHYMSKACTLCAHRCMRIAPCQRGAAALHPSASGYTFHPVQCKSYMIILGSS